MSRGGAEAAGLILDDEELDQASGGASSMKAYQRGR